VPRRRGGCTACAGEGALRGAARALEGALQGAGGTREQGERVSWEQEEHVPWDLSGEHTSSPKLG